MTAPGRRRKLILVTILGACILALAVTLNVGWIVLNWRTGLMLVLGVLLFALLIAGVVLNTIFLIREVRRNEQHDAFINAVTHELKTPLASIRLYLETLKRREPPAEKRNEFYDVMLGDTERLIGTIEQVLEAGRAGSARKPRDKFRLDLTELVRECVDLARVRHHLSPESLTCGAVDAAWVEGDPADLKAAVSNLLDNAIKYSGSKIKIHEKVASSDSGRVAVRIHDEGVGIDTQQLKHIFKRFYRIPNTLGQRVKGTGLGLFIVKSIARRHGGNAFAQSRGAGHGSTFTLELPRAANRGLNGTS